MNHIKRFNKMLRDELGTAPNGQPRFKWELTSNLYGFEEAPNGEAVHQVVREDGTMASIVLIHQQFQKFCWADVYGKRWVLVKWEVVSEEEWRIRHGHSLPYASNGEYIMTDNMMLADHIEPDELTTLVCIKLIKPQLTVELNQGHPGLVNYHRRQAIERKAAEKAVYRQAVSDAVDELALPFDQKPGTKGSASLPTPAFMKKAPIEVSQ